MLFCISSPAAEDHDLVYRKNQKDLSLRLVQFFDYYLKDAKWIIDGLPATDKGNEWVFGLKNSFKYPPNFNNF